MPDLPITKPETLGFDPARLQRVFDLAKHWTDTDHVPAIGLCIGRDGKILEPFFSGRQRMDKNSPAIKPDALFLVASLSKPVTVTAVMMLVERGLLSLDDPVVSIVPKFAANGKGSVRIRHLMTHTSGLPDMPPDNEKLRQAHAPFSAFVESTCNLPLMFEPGTKVSYQSMGTAMLGEIVHQVSGKSLPEFLRKEVFAPLGMSDTSLGWNPAKKERIAAVRVIDEHVGPDWKWNSSYWLGFGAPWGGLITTPAEYGKFCQIFMNGGRLGDVQILSPATVRAMTSNQLQAMPLVPEEERRCRPWGLGWRLNWPAHSANFGDLLGPRSFGHWGATGTLSWCDPDSRAFAVILTTQPQEPEGRFLARLSNAILASIIR
jgi:CubicO group peptidase (beta-lactamase class C family)